jgi:hypothetical protein
VTIYLVHSGKSDRVTIRMHAESPAHVPTKITGDLGMANYAQSHADHGSTVYQIAADWGTHSYLEREDGEEEPRCPNFDQLLAELDARKYKRVEE